MQTSITRRRSAFLYFVILGLTFGLTAGRYSVAQAKPAIADFATIDTYLAGQMKQLQIPGLTVSIVQSDQITHLQGFGAADDTGRLLTPQTPMMLGSVSKSFTALAVMQLVEQDKIELDAPVEHYLPWFRLADESAAAPLHQLNQTSGFTEMVGNRWWLNQAGLEALVRRLQTMALAYPVGQHCTGNYA